MFLKSTKTGGTLQRFGAIEITDDVGMMQRQKVDRYLELSVGCVASPEHFVAALRGILSVVLMREAEDLHQLASHRI